jgi:hypothetical protein
MSDKRPRIWPPVLLLVLGPVLAVASLGVLIGGAVSTITAPTFEIPGSTRRTLDKGVYVVFEDTGSGFSAGSTTIGPEDVQVTDPDGARITTRRLNSTETIDRNGSRFLGAVKFTVVTPGEYDVEVSAGNGTAVVGPSLVDSVGKKLGWLAGIGVGGLAFLVGLIWLILALRRRGKNKAALAGAYPTYQPAPSVPSAAAPGWYPDSERPGSQRYWDGTSWTEHRS